jgi:hypothetical protein
MGQDPTPVCKSFGCRATRFDNALHMLYTRYMANPKELIAIRIKPRHLAELKKIAKADDDSVSEVIRKAIEEYLAKRK